MIRTIRVLTACLVLLAFFAARGCGEAAEEVRETFDRYMAAVNAKDADGALAVVDPVYLEHLDYLVKMARSGERERVLALSAMERQELLRMRNRLTREELQAMDGRGWLRLSVERGWEAGDPDEGRMSLGKVKFRMPRANAEIMDDGEATGVQLQLVKSEGKWRIDFTSMDDLFSRVILKAAGSENVVDQFLLAEESDQSGKRVTQAIWDTPK